MLWSQRPGTPQLALAACLVFALPIIIYYRLPQGQSFSKLTASIHTTSSPAPPALDNSSLIEQIEQYGDGHINLGMEGGPRIRQASMLFGSGEKGEDALYERAMRTHIKHGQRWGYTSHILRKDIVGKGDWKVLVRQYLKPQLGFGDTLSKG